MARASDLVAAFWRGYRASGEVDRGVAHELAELALASEEGSQGLFAEIVEPLADSFDLGDARAFVELFGGVLMVARRHPDLRALDAVLPSTSEVVARGRTLLDESTPTPLGSPDTVFVLSRVTLGAEVAITTPIVSALLQRLPKSRIVFVGPPGSHGIFAGEPRVECRALSYPRRGGLLARLRAWLELREIVEREAKGDDWLVVDPDSRFTQSGLLPLAPPERTRFLPSRTIGGEDFAALGQVSQGWAQTLGELDEPPPPRVWLTDGARAWASDLVGRLRDRAARWAVVNFGTGGNERKGLGMDFERDLLGRLLAMGLGVLMTRGAGPEEDAAFRAVADGIGTPVQHLAPGELPANPDARLVTWQEPTERMAALVAAADLHLGYDSAGQHVAAAVGTPGVTLFVPLGGERYFARWAPFGTGATRVIRVELGERDLEAVAAAAIGAASQLLNAPRR